MYGPLPIEMAVFGDMGAAGDRSRSLRLTGVDRNLVRSVGAAARINLLGLRSRRSITFVRSIVPARLMWQFNFRPGF
jgi:hypothetical protein